MAKDRSQPEGKGDGNGKTAPEASPAAGSAAQRPEDGPQLNVVGQYIKDLSFESPKAPGVLQTPPSNPQLQVSVNVGAAPRAANDYEVVLNLEVKAVSDNGMIYNVELAYGGLFRLRNIPEAMMQPVLFVDCPTILFPFMRRVLADITRDGGFPPLMLDPIDFRRLYAENMAPSQAESKN